MCVPSQNNMILSVFAFRCDDVCQRTDPAVQESQSTDAEQEGQGEPTVTFIVNTLKHCKNYCNPNPKKFK